MPGEIERFWNKVNKTETCWLWTGAKRNKGYGAFVYRRGGQVVQGRAHRYSYEMYVGLIPVGMMVLHRCDNPPCVRPDHLFLGTNQDNVMDMMSKGRHVAGGTHKAGNYKKGTDHHGAKLTPTLVREIRSRRDTGISFSRIAAEYGLAIGHVFRIVHRQVWKQVE